MRLLLLLLLPIFTSISYAAESGTPSTSTAADANAKSPSSTVESGINYRLKPNDLIRFSIFGEPDTLTDVRISQDGKISLPLIGSVEVGKLTLAQAREKIYSLYKPDYFVNPQINLIIVEYAPRYVKVEGHVNRPGTVQLPIDKDFYLQDVISQCGGLDNLAKRGKISVIRNATGKEEVYDYDKIGPKQVKIEEDDLIKVPERWI